MLIVKDITNWSNTDIFALENWIDAYARLIGDKHDNRAIIYIKSAIAIEHEPPFANIDIWYNTSLTLIFYHITTQIKRRYKDTPYVMDAIKKLEQSFSPKINGSSSSFGNCLDDIDFEKSGEEIISQTVKLLQGDGYEK